MKRESTKKKKKEKSSQIFKRKAELDPLPLGLCLVPHKKKKAPRPPGKGLTRVANRQLFKREKKKRYIYIYYRTQEKSANLI